MKKTITLTLLLAACLTAGAQEEEKKPDFERGIFNHVGLNAGVGTEGYTFALAAPLTPYVEITAGMNTTPTFNISTKNVDINAGSLGHGSTNLKMKVQRTTFDLKANVYPFGGNSAFFVAGGLSVGGGKVIEATAHSQGAADALRQNGQQQVTLHYEGYDFVFDQSGTVTAEAKVNSVRPYLGIGTGRHVNRGRFGFAAELGAQFMGSVKFYQNGREIVKDAHSDKAIWEKLSLYPVLRLTLTGRIL